MAAPRTLYVSRPLINGEDLIAWAKAQGFPTAMLPGDLHTTIAYSREPFDWSGLEPAGGQLVAPMTARSIQQFGKATVLGFESPELHGRWQLLRQAGASWDFPSYQPHVTFTYDPGDVPLDQVQPYRGPLLFGPEVFAEINDDWSSNLEEKSRAAPILGFGPMTDLFVAPFEVKAAAGSADTGEFEGYGAVFNNVDWHGDVIVPGAFSRGLAERKAAGRSVAMHLNHGLPQLLGRRGVGVWKALTEDSRGLEVKGKVSGMNTEAGRLLYEGIKDGALPGMSIGYVVRPNGAEFGTKAAAIATGARRVLRDIALEEISIVDTPSNAQSLVLQVKAQGIMFDQDRARAGIAALMALHDRAMVGHAAPTAADRAEFLSHLQDLQHAVGGPALDAGTKAAPATVREFEATLRDVGFSHSQARDIAAAGFPKTLARDEPGGQATPPEAKSALSSVLAEIAAFRL